MILAPTNRRIIRPGDKPSFEHTQRYGLIKDHPLGPAGGLVFFPIMNEGSGTTVRDLSGNGNDGTLTNGPIWQPGKSGSCIDFDGGDDEIYRSVSNALSGNTEVTIIVRLKREGAGGDNAGRIFTFGPENDYEYILYDNDSVSTLDFNRARVTTTGRWQLDYSGITILNTWIDWAVTYDGSSTGNNPKFYANAVPMTSINESTAPDGALKVTGTNEFTIGNRHSDSARGYNGKIEFIYIYNRALSTSEIASVYWNPFCMVEKKTAPVYFFVPAILVGGLSDVTELQLLEHVVGKTPFSKPTAYIGFCTADPGEDATGGSCNEVAGANGYERIATAAGDWGNAAAGAIENTVALASPYATGSWGEITHFVLVDSPTYGEGEVLAYDALDAPKTIEDKDNLEFAIGDLAFTLN